MAEGSERRCPNCRALVGEGAEWCGQCFTDLRSPQSSRAQAEPRIEVPVGVTGADQPNGHQPDGREPVGGETPVTAEPSETGWPCASCGRRNPMEANLCLSCGTPFGQGFEPPEERPSITPTSGVKWSLLYPGLGHLKAGRTGDAVARAVVFTWPFVTGLLFLSAHPAGRLGAIGAFGITFLMAAALLYIAIAIDAGRMADGQAPMISNRALLWIAAGIVLCSAASAALVGLSGMSTLRNR
ncbi:MAG TPA: zinc ribbon domain-containing protein [Actinomycetota bacterium]|jgi:hypothetical protein